MCPTTEADLGDGIGPARELADAGAQSSPWAATSTRCLTPTWNSAPWNTGNGCAAGNADASRPTEISAAARDGGPALAGAAGERRPHAWCRPHSVRTAGSRPAQLPLTATAADIAAVYINGELVARNGIHTRLGDPADLYAAFFADHPEFS